MTELWRTVLFPVFVEKRYPGRYFRLLEGIAAIQRGRHQDAYLGAYGLAQLTGIEVKNVKRLLRRLVADEVLQIVEWGAPGRYSADERYGAPGRAHKYSLGAATYPQADRKGSETTPIERGQGRPLTRPRKGSETTPIERGQGRPPISSGVSYDPPSSEKDARPMPARADPAVDNSPPVRGLAALHPDLEAAPVKNGSADLAPVRDLLPLVIRRRRGRVSLVVGKEEPDATTH